MIWREFPLYFSFEKFPVRTFCTTRKTGCSLPPYNSCNLSFTTGDSRETVKRNRIFIAESLGIPINDFVFLKQVHGSSIAEISKKHCAKALEPGDIEADGMICDQPGIAISVLLADCGGIVLYDPVKNVQAVCHSGWRGMLKNICGKLVDKMAKNCGCNRDNIIAGIGPAICGHCYETGVEIVKKFTGDYHGFIREKEEKYFLDLPGIIEKQLFLSGINKENIENSRICTYSNTHLWYSHRAEKKTGRFLLGIYNPAETPPIKRFK